VQPPPDNFDDAVALEVSVMVSCIGAAEGLSAAARHRRRRVRVHLKVDTGMGRQGADPADAPDILRKMAALDGIDTEGVATHFATCEIPGDPFTLDQIAAFRSLLDTLERGGIRPPMAHASCSGAIVNYPGIASFDAVRPGLMTYGVWPCDSPSQVEPVLRWETRICLVREIPAGASVGYGRTYVTSAPERVAVLPVGYADGYKWSLGNKGEVLVRGARCPVRGRVSMDQIVVDVTHVPGVAPGDTAVLIGTDGDASVTAAETARLAGTIPYDILTGLGRRVARVVRE
jgi:alanine racemase